MNWNRIIGGIAIVGFGIVVYHLYRQAKDSKKPEIKKK